MVWGGDSLSRHPCRGEFIRRDAGDGVGGVVEPVEIPATHLGTARVGAGGGEPFEPASQFGIVAGFAEVAAFVFAKGKSGRKPGLVGVGAQGLPGGESARLGQRAQDLLQQIDDGFDIPQGGMGIARGQAVELAQGLEFAVARRDGVEQAFGETQGAEAGATDGRASA